MKERIIPSTMIFKGQTLETALRHIREAGYDRAEMCVVPGWVDHYDVKNATADTLAQVIRVVADSGVRIEAVNLGISWLNGNGDIAYGMEKTMMNALNLASALGAKVMTIAAGVIPPEDKKSIWLKKIAGRNAELADMAAARGIQLSIEAPHKRSIAEGRDEIVAYWNDQADNVRMTLDPAHMVYAGVDPVQIAALYAGRVAHAHLRDAVAGNSLLKYGEGCMDFKAYIGALNEGGYQGLFSMEFPTDSEEEGIERLKHARAFFEALYAE